MDTLAKAGGASPGDIPLHEFLPREAPIDMAAQPLRRFEPPPAPDFSPMWTRRGFVLTGTAVLTAAGCYEMYRVLQVGGVTVLAMGSLPELAHLGVRTTPGGRLANPAEAFRRSFLWLLQVLPAPDPAVPRPGVVGIEPTMRSAQGRTAPAIRGPGNGCFRR